MRCRLPGLQLTANSLRVFSHSGGFLEEARRLEYLCWRLWNRESLRYHSSISATPVSTRRLDGRSTAEVHDVSGSSDSVANEEAIKFDNGLSTSSSNALDCSRHRPRILDSVTSGNRDRERHITSIDLEKMVLYIKEKEDLKPLNIRTSPLLILEETSQPQERPHPQLSNTSTISTTSVASSSSAMPAPSIYTSGKVQARTTVVRGFYPAHASSAYKSVSLLSAISSIPATNTSTTKSQTPHTSRNNVVFNLRPSSTDKSSREDFDTTSSAKPSSNQLSTSSYSTELVASLELRSLSRRSLPEMSFTESNRSPPKTQTSFHVQAATVLEKKDDINVSDSVDLGLSNENDGRANVNAKLFFQRVDPTIKGTSCQSLITTMLQQDNSISPILDSMSDIKRLSVHRGHRKGMTSLCPPGSESARLGTAQTPPQPIARATTAPHQFAFSPRSTRRDMLITELSVSLRQSILWERQQRWQRANVVLMRKLDVQVDRDEKDENSSLHKYIRSSFGEYHSNGW